MPTYSVTPHEHVEVVTSTAELLAVDCTWTDGGELPPLHFHPAQDERFTVAEGRLRAIVGGDERVYAPGDAFEVPRGTTHTLLPVGGACRARWEIRPALGTEAFFREMAMAEGSTLRQLKVVVRHPDEFRLTGTLGVLVKVLRAARVWR